MSFRILIRKFEPFETAVSQFWKSFQAKTGTDIQPEFIALDLPQLHEQIINGDYDVAHVNTDWIAQCHATNAVEDLSPYIKESPPQDYPMDWHHAQIELQTFDDGKILGIPFHCGPECLIYRKDLFEDCNNKQLYFEKYGVPLALPSTWEDFERLARFFNDPQNNLYGTVFALYPDGHNNIFDFALQVWSYDGSLTDADGNIALNTPQAAQAMARYRRLLQQDFIHPESKNLESIGSAWRFAAGEIALMVNWFGFGTLCETAPDSKTKGKVGIAHIPHNTASPLSLNVYYTWCISSKSKQKQLAYDYIKHAVSPENDIDLTLLGGIGCRRSTWKNEAVNATIPYYHELDSIYEYVRTLPRIADWHKVCKIIDNLMLRIAQTDDPIDQILTQAQQQVLQQNIRR